MLEILHTDESKIIFNPSSSNSHITTISYLGKTFIHKASPSKVDHEFSLIQNLSHKNIIKVHSQDTPNSFIMEFCPQGDLKPSKPLDSEELIQTFKQMCEAVQYLHSLDICHLDIKLENFVKDENGVVKLIDFEFAQNALKPVRSERGTNIYNAPERKLEEYEGKQADIFSLGVCLVGLMAGFVPATRDKQVFVHGKSFIQDVDLFWKQMASQVLKTWKNFDGFDELGCELAVAMVNVDSSKRPSIDEVLNNEFFEI